MCLKAFLKRAAGNERVRSYLLIVLGCLIGGAAYPLFLTPNSIAPGGLTGVATILHHLFGWPVGAVSLILNLPLFLISYRSMGRIFAFRSLIATVLFSVVIDLLKLPPIQGDMVLATVYGSILLGFGIGLILRGGATTGGTDMIARIAHRYIPFLSVGAWLFAFDCAVVLAAWFTMSATLSLYSLICIFVSARCVDIVFVGLKSRSIKACYIISEKAPEITRRIMAELERGATLLKSIGAYSGAERDVILCLLSVREVSALKAIVKQEDKTAFMFITGAQEALGEGFMQLDENA